MYKPSLRETDTNTKTKQNLAAPLYESNNHRRQLWKDAIKWPLYSIAVMPIVLAAGWTIGQNKSLRIDQFLGFLVASISLLLWENLTNDLFDSETGVDELNKPHSIVALLGGKHLVRKISSVALAFGLLIIYLLALRSSNAVFFLVIGSCLLGYLYQGPPFRLGYKGLGEPLCWLAFGPLATAASLIVLSPTQNSASKLIPWNEAMLIGSGPALATTLVLFCSHFHQVIEDAAHGKKSPLVRLGTRKASHLIPWVVSITLALEWLPIIHGTLPITSLLGIISLPPAISLIKLLKRHHNKPKLIEKSKFLALKFQTLNGFGFSFGLAMARFIDFH